MINIIRSVIDKLIHDDGEISLSTISELFPSVFGNLKKLYGTETDFIFGETDKCMDFLCNYLKQHKNIDTNNAVSNPSHYIEGRKYEPRKVISDWNLNFNLGNAVKYIARAGRKDDKIEDLQKAIQYIKFEIEECSKSSEYDEMLEVLRNKSPEDKIKIKKYIDEKFGINKENDEYE